MDFINENIFIKCSYGTYLRANKIIPFIEHDIAGFDSGYVDLNPNCGLWEQFQIIPTGNNK